MPKTVRGEDVPVMTLENYFGSGEKFRMQISTDFPDYVGILHRHEYIEVVYVISGTATHTIQGKSYEVKRGDLCFVDVGAIHMFTENKKGSDPLVVYDLMFIPEFFDRSLTDRCEMGALGDSYMFRALLREPGVSDHSFHVSENLYAKFSELFNKMYDEYCNRNSGYMEIIRAYLLQVVVTALRMNDIPDRRKGAVHKEWIVESVMAYIQNHYDTAITVQELADNVHVSPDYLGRVFKEVAGETISTRIQKTRIHNACRLLTSTQRTVADIATACGFGDAKFFYSVFKKYMGMSPGDYRKKAK